MRNALHSILLVAMLCSCSLVQPARIAPPAERPAFNVLYTAWIKPAERIATVKIRLSRHPEWVRWMRFSMMARS